MKNTLLLVMTLWVSAQTAFSQIQIERTLSFDADWRFKKGQGLAAQGTDYNDADWRKLDLPHDWSIEDLDGQVADSVQGPFSKASLGKMSTGNVVGGTAWYRKHFNISKADAGKTAYLQFDGVYMNSDVWVNGKHLGHYPYGYTSFYYDITPYLNPVGQSNVVAVEVKNEGLNTRWYSGSGIYRHTWLTMVNPVHIAPWGVYVSSPNISAQKASVEVVTTVSNVEKKNLKVNYVVKILNPNGLVVGKANIQGQVRAGQTTDLKQILTVNNPMLWSIENPKLYHTEVEVLINGKTQDKLKTAFGIRSLHFDAQTGFSLNGKTVKLKGGCIHHDNGPLGTAAFDRAEERKIELLKKAGFNAIRLSHNPSSPYLLDVCDRLGMLVIDEAFDMWEKSKLEMFDKREGVTDYSKSFKEWWKKDIQSLLMRDRNHPSVIMWSIGNEIVEAADSTGLRIATELTNEVKKYDRSRAVTEAHNDLMAIFGRPSDWEQRDAHFAALDVAGYNYAYNKYETDHQKHPKRIMFGSETYPDKGLENWDAVEKHPYVIGAFSWTAMDYIGESGIGLPRLIPDTLNVPPGFAGMMIFFNPNSWPIFNSYCGDLDLIGNRKAASYYQNVVWRNTPIEMFVHRPIPVGMKELQALWGFPDELKSWTWSGHENDSLQVRVFSRSPKVKLELNGKIIGEQTIPTGSITATFTVLYTAGKLIARCYDGDKEIASETLITAGKPSSIRLKADRTTIKADNKDLSFINVEIIDDAGNVVPQVDDILVKYQISGNGNLAGVGNGNPRDVSSFQKPEKKVFQGKGLLIVKSTNKAGKIEIKATGNGLKESILTIEAKN